MEIPTYHAERDPRSNGKWMLLLAGMVSLMVVTVSAFASDWIQSQSTISIPLLFLCGTPPLLAVVYFGISLLRSRGGQHWTISDGTVSYVSPCPTLGESFRANIHDITELWIEADSDFANCRLKSGEVHRFRIDQIEGLKFYEILRPHISTASTDSGFPKRS